MDSIATFFSILANIAQVVSVLWLIFAGTKTLSDFRKGKPATPHNLQVPAGQKRSLGKGLRRAGLPLALLILILSSGVWVFLRVTPHQLYQANDAQGWKDWQLSTEWSPLDDLLVSSGAVNSANFALAPYQPDTPNYAIEAEIKLLHPGYGSFGIFARGSNQYSGSSYQGYAYPGNSYQGYNYTIANAVSSTVSTESNFSAEITGSTAQQNNQPNPISLDTDWHTYRIELKGEEITTFMDGRQLNHITDSTYLPAGRVGIFSNATQINVRSFKVSTV